jgi:pimeloyl-ACP methyl ester carboxylesterase
MSETKPGSSVNPWFDYMRDAFERSVLFVDVLRQRGNIYEEQTKRIAPHVLTFQAELVCDGRELEKPVNYVLTRITPPKGVAIDASKRPFIVFDPRAGHGPGIGGMKNDSEIGVAMRAGHPCYFVGFLPNPMPGQTVEDVCRAEAHFVKMVTDLHAEADGKPALIGNCQAGWQIMIMAALYPELAGPIVVVGSPLSYWAGVHGKNPMRYLGGMMGGSWVTALSGDLGAGKFDGASLIANFESNNPANTLWSKPYNLYAKVDTEAARFLEFEKWWGVPVILNAQEMQFIVDELFIGNRLAAGKTIMSDGKRVDLRKISSPIVVFCSFGDDITPPQQALDWILDLYETVDQMIQSGQTIIYCLHQSIGHLGIFVSGAVATKEHEEFALNMNMIDAMPPGLYEVVLSEMDANTTSPQLVSGRYIAKIVPRTLDDIRALGCNDAADERKFETVARVSEINEGLYRTFVSPAVKAMMTPAAAELMREMHPSRLYFSSFSDRNPAMAPVAQLARDIRNDGNRHPVSPDNPFLMCEKIVSSWIVSSLEAFGKAREAWTEAVFHSTYGSANLQAAVGLKSDRAQSPQHAVGALQRAENAAKLEAEISRGGLLEAGLRALIYVLRGAGVDERQFNAIEQIRAAAPENERVSGAQLKSIVRRQATLLRGDQARAMAAIPAMLPDDPSRRRKVVATIENVVSAKGALTAQARDRIDEISRLFGVPRKEA